MMTSPPLQKIFPPRWISLIIQLLTHNAALASLNMDVMFEYTPGDFNNIDDAVTNNAEPSPSVPPISLTHESPLTTFNKILEKDHCKLGK